MRVNSKFSFKRQTTRSTWLSKFTTLKYQQVKDFARYLDTLLPWIREIGEHTQGDWLGRVVLNYALDDMECDDMTLLQNETCYFLAIDFDKDHWQKDVTAFVKVCDKYQVPSLVERSQSGNGAHVWIFFEESISSSLVRNLGTALLTLTMQLYPH